MEFPSFPRTGLEKVTQDFILDLQPKARFRNPGYKSRWLLMLEEWARNGVELRKTKTAATTKAWSSTTTTTRIKSGPKALVFVLERTGSEESWKPPYPNDRVRSPNDRRQSSDLGAEAPLSPPVFLDPDSLSVW